MNWQRLGGVGVMMGLGWVAADTNPTIHDLCTPEVRPLGEPYLFGDAGSIDHTGTFGAPMGKPVTAEEYAGKYLADQKINGVKNSFSQPVGLVVVDDFETLWPMPGQYSGTHGGLVLAHLGKLLEGAKFVAQLPTTLNLKPNDGDLIGKPIDYRKEGTPGSPERHIIVQAANHHTQIESSDRITSDIGRLTRNAIDSIKAFDSNITHFVINNSYSLLNCETSDKLSKKVITSDEAARDSVIENYVGIFLM